MRKTIIQVHLFLAALVAPAIILVAISGGLYLFGVPGEVKRIEIDLQDTAQLDFQSSDLRADVDTLLQKLQIEHHYDYLKHRGTTIQTRPTSRTYLEFNLVDGALKLSRNQPDLQKSLIELHTGHGPALFKTYQKGVAVSLLFIILSGLWMGLTSPALRRRTWVTGGLGLVIFLVLVLT